MHSDLLMLRVACRVVEGATQSVPASAADAASTAATAGTSADDAKRMVAQPLPLPTHFRMPRLVLPTISMSTQASSSSWDARRIPSLRVTKPPSSPTDTAHVTVGLKRQRSDHAEDTNNDHDDGNAPRPKRATTDHVRLSPPAVPPPPGVFMDSPLARLVHAQRPPPPTLPIRSPLGVESMTSVAAMAPADDKNQTRVTPATFMSFIGHAASRRDTDDHAGEKLSPLESPRLSTLEPAPANTLRVPSLPQWRSPVLTSRHAPPKAAATLSPTLASSESSLYRTAPPLQHELPLPSLSSCRPSTTMPPLALPVATTKPTLVRKSSAPWREQMPAHDRTRTRERILRGLDRQCRGNYEALLHIVTALEEELLHAHTTSKDHYFLQTVALRDRIGTLSPPGTSRPPVPPPHLQHQHHL